MQSWMIGLVPGLVFTGFLPQLPPLPLLWSVLLALAGLAVGVHCRRFTVARVAGGLACGCALGLAHGAILLQSRIAEECVGVPLVVSGAVGSLPVTSRMHTGGLRQRFEFTVDKLTPAGCSKPQKLLLSYYGDRRLQPGDAWQFQVKLKKPWGLANPGSYNLQAWLSQQGIDAVGSVRETRRNQKLPTPPVVSSLPDRLRQRISDHINTLPLDSEVSAILRAVTVADSSGINPPLWLLFQQFGINHLLVISGLHVAMVAAVGYLLGGLSQRVSSGAWLGGAWLPAIFALVLAVFYAALAGFSLPVQRALFMLACFVVARLSGRGSGAANSLLLAAAAVLLLNPLAAVGSGFWLSFGAVSALLWAARWQRGLGPARRVWQTQVSMSLLMLPLGALFFGGGSLVAVLANLVMIPLVGWVVVPLALLAVVCFLCGWPLQSLLWQLAGWPLAQVLPLAKYLADNNVQWLYLPLSADTGLVLIALLAVAQLMLPTRPVIKLLSLTLALPLLLPIDLSAAASSLNTEVTVLDVGQGTAVVVRSADRTLLYDTGGGDPEGVNMGSLVVLPYLNQHGIRALDTLVISHPDLDHSAGAAVVRNAVETDRVRYGGEQAAGAGGLACVAGESWRWPGGQVFQFLSPAQEMPRRRNDSSCVLQIQVGDYRLLLPGDIEQERERMLVQFWGDQLRSDWLLAAHHGSKTSSTPTMLKHVQAETAVISSGYMNRFGHPHASVIHQLQDRGVNILSTAGEGAITFTLTQEKGVQISSHRQIVRRYWM